MKLTFPIPDELEMRLKLISILTRTKLQTLGLAAITAYVEQQEAELAKKHPELAARLEKSLEISAPVVTSTH